MPVIYLARNKENKKPYIGWSSNFIKRKSKHFRLAALGSKYAFHRAIRKYGIDNFTWEILYESKDVEFVRDIMESYFIRLYDSQRNGYNMSGGGEGVMEGRKHTLKSRRSMSINTSGEKNPNYRGKCMTPEVREKLRKAALGNSYRKGKFKKIS